MVMIHQESDEECLIVTFRFSVSAGSFSIPNNCNDTCSFRVSWEVNGDQVEFSVLAAVRKGVWAGIGFSKDQMMVRVRLASL